MALARGAITAASVAGGTDPLLLVLPAGGSVARALDAGADDAMLPATPAEEIVAKVLREVDLEHLVEKALGMLLDFGVGREQLVNERVIDNAKVESYETEFDKKPEGTLAFFGEKYGRIVLTTSSSGLYGNFGQSNYGAAKLGIIGLMQTLKIEGQKNNIHVNAISPVAATRMTENLGIPPEIFDKLKPEYVTPGVVYLCSEEAPTGAILTAGAGAFALARIYETEGVYLGEGGLSGAPLLPRSLEVVRRLRARLGEGPTVIGVGGIGALIVAAAGVPVEVIETLSPVMMHI